jgi:ribosomal protein S21
VRELLQEKMGEEETYQAAREQYLSEPPSELKSREDKYPKRQELHER